ncbi:MAG TPA: VWA domain-containing protein [Firmicutes bacterium]|nr:VWA domain-containing protein [Bacillota bacterium]
MSGFPKVPEEIKLVGDYIGSVLSSGRGLRLGEAAVVSKRVHTIDPNEPERVSILTGADAGRVFYRRHQKDQVIHIDVFHEIGPVDHRRVAALIREAFRDAADTRMRDLPDFMDVQTATGGGRVTGTLMFGNRPSLKRAHLNHVHVAAMVEDSLLWALILLIAAVEKAIHQSGFQLRMIEHLTNVTSQGMMSQLDLSDYSSVMDSYLQENEPNIEDTILHYSDMQEALELADELGGVEEAGSILEAVENRSHLHSLVDWLSSKRECFSDIADELLKRGLVTKQGWGLNLTERGRRVADIFKYRRKELEAQFKRMMRKLPAVRYPSPKVDNGNRRVLPWKAWRWGSAMPLEPGEWVSGLAIPETVLKAAFREHSSRQIQIHWSDIMLYKRLSTPKSRVLLLVDASASMAGKRIRAAKHLARHLLLSTREKVAIAVFQENAVKLVVPFTRDYKRLEEGIRTMQPTGLTPLAEGICFAVSYIKSCRAKSVLLLMITDGIPTVPKWTLNPVEDALKASAMLSDNHIKFSCIGLEPNRAFLDELTARAKGNLYVLEELEKEALFNIARSETDRLKAKRV